MRSVFSKNPCLPFTVAPFLLNCLPIGLLCVELKRGTFQLQAWSALSRLQAALLLYPGHWTSSTFVKIY